MMPKRPFGQISKQKNLQKSLEKQCKRSWNDEQLNWVFMRKTEGPWPGGITTKIHPTSLSEIWEKSFLYDKPWKLSKTLDILPSHVFSLQTECPLPHVASVPLSLNLRSCWMPIAQLIILIRTVETQIIDQYHFPSWNKKNSLFYNHHWQWLILNPEAPVLFAPRVPWSSLILTAQPAVAGDHSPGRPHSWGSMRRSLPHSWASPLQSAGIRTGWVNEVVSNLQKNCWFNEHVGSMNMLVQVVPLAKGLDLVMFIIFGKFTRPSQHHLSPMAVGMIRDVTNRLKSPRDELHARWKHGWQMNRTNGNNKKVAIISSSNNNNNSHHKVDNDFKKNNGIVTCTK